MDAVQELLSSGSDSDFLQYVRSGQLRDIDWQISDATSVATASSLVQRLQSAFQSSALHDEAVASLVVQCFHRLLAPELLLLAEKPYNPHFYAIMLQSLAVTAGKISGSIQAFITLHYQKIVPARPAWRRALHRELQAVATGAVRPRRAPGSAAMSTAASVNASAGLLNLSPEAVDVFGPAQFALQMVAKIFTGVTALNQPAHQGMILRQLCPLLMMCTGPGSLPGDPSPYAVLHGNITVALVAGLAACPASLVEVVQFIVTNWPATTAGASTGELLLLHTLDTSLGVLLSGDDMGVSSADRSQIAMLLLPRICSCVQSTNSRIAQRALLFFNDHAKPMRQAWVAAGGSTLKKLVDALTYAPLHSELHWNATVNRMTAAVLRGLLEDSPDVVRKLVKQAVEGRPGGAPKSKFSVQASFPQAHAEFTKFATSVPSSVAHAAMLNAAAAAAPEPAPAVPVKQSPVDYVLSQLDAASGVAAGGVRDTQLSPQQATLASVSNDAEFLSDEPKLLPSLQFLDLAFGHELGRGNFSTVKFAKAIRPGASADSWPCYAVKCIAAEVLAGESYARNVDQELAVLRTLTHPGIARCVAAFQRQGSAYLVLEYAGGGDLHTALVKHGSLSVRTAAWILAEMVTALAHVHDQGWAFGDFKTENIVFTTSGHAKLTDAGGARPLPGPAGEKARALLRASRGIAAGLRSGHWAASAEESVDRVAPSSSSASDAGEADDEDDLGQIEATLMYLAPECVHGAAPSAAADAWALGCVAYFVLTGRPPVWAAEDADMPAAVVSFDQEQLTHWPEDTPASAKSLVHQLLSRAPEERLPAAGMSGLLQHPFFAEMGVPAADELYSSAVPEFSPGAVTSQAGAAWTRRQYSTMFAPMPAAVDVSDAVQSRRAAAADSGRENAWQEQDLERSSGWKS